MEIVVNRIIWYSPPHASNLLFMNILWKQERLNPNKIVAVFQMPIVVSVAAAMGSDWRSFIRKFHWVGQQQQQQQWWRAVKRRLEERLIVQAATLYQGVGVTFLGKRSPWKWKEERDAQWSPPPSQFTMVRKSFPHSISHRLLEKRAMAVFIYFAFPGMASKTRPTSWYDRTSPFYFAIRKLTTEVLKNVMTPTQKSFSLLWSKY